MNAYILLYKPPCGRWYVHSHKLYPTKAAAYEAAAKFLCPGTPYTTRPVNLAELDQSVNDR